MNQKVFTDQINRLILCYGANPFNSERIKLIRNIVDEMPDHEFILTVNHMIENSRTFPTPNDFRNAFYSWKRSSNTYQEIITVTKISCEDCQDTGYIFCKMSDSEPRTLTFCHCKEGEKSESYSKCKYMPRWEKGKFETVYGFIKLPFPASEFVPKESLRSEVTFEQLEKTNLVANFLKTKRNAENYWYNKVKTSQ